MQTEEKVKEFERRALEEAERKRRKNLKEINFKVKEESQKGLREVELISKEKVDYELYKLTQIKNKEIQHAKNTSKKTLIILRNEYKENIFSNVEKRLYEFTNTNKYKNYLINNIKKILDYTTEIYLTKKDMKYESIIKEELEVDILISESNDDFIGGFKAVMVNKNIIIDNSFKAKLLDEKEKFKGFKIV